MYGRLCAIQPAALPWGPHHPCEGSQPVQRDLIEQVPNHGSSSPLRGFATDHRHRPPAPLLRPHHPCEGSQQGVRPGRAASQRSSSPLRGFATAGRRATTRRSRGPHRLCKGSQLTAEPDERVAFQVLIAPTRVRNISLPVSLNSAPSGLHPLPRGRNTTRRVIPNSSASVGAWRVFARRLGRIRARSLVVGGFLQVRGVRRWDCKSVGLAYAGSNPAPATAAEIASDQRKWLEAVRVSKISPHAAGRRQASPDGAGPGICAE